MPHGPRSQSNILPLCKMPRDPRKASWVEQSNQTPPQQWQDLGCLQRLLPADISSYSDFTGWPGTPPPPPLTKSQGLGAGTQWIENQNQLPQEKSDTS